MISYETYKLLHLITLFMIVSCLGVVIGEGRWISSKKFKTITSVISLLVFVGGMGLIARIGFKHGEPFPLWIWVKMACWVLLNISLVMLFKMQRKKFKIVIGVFSFLIVFIGVYSAVTKLA